MVRSDDAHELAWTEVLLLAEGADGLGESVRGKVDERREGARLLGEAGVQRIPHGIADEDHEHPRERPHQQRCDGREDERQSPAQAARQHRHG